jgi:hypothetical protein
MDTCVEHYRREVVMAAHSLANWILIRKGIYTDQLPPDGEELGTQIAWSLEGMFIREPN